MKTLWNHFMWTQHTCCRRRDKSRIVILVSELTDEDLRAIAAAEVLADYEYLNEELVPD